MHSMTMSLRKDFTFSNHRLLCHARLLAGYFFDPPSNRGLSYDESGVSAFPPFQAKRGFINVKVPFRPKYLKILRAY